jgi:hypothetical protein
MNQSSSKRKSSPALRSATGRDYAEWFQLLDAWGAPGRSYREIADWLVDQGVSDWWTQKLIVEYEQDRGLRQPGARPDGSFAGGASKTVPFSIDQLYAAFADSELRRCWLPDLELTERTARPGRSIRFDAADGSRVSAEFATTGAGKAQVAVEQEGLRDAAAAEQAKRDWRRRLAGLKEWLAGLTERPQPPR